MGYYTQTIKCNFLLPTENFAAAYDALCHLNRHDNLKQGGSFGSGPRRQKPAGSTSCSNNPDRWFSWMAWNYDEICTDLVQILEMLGFSCYITDQGIEYVSYDNKTGQEDLFFQTLAPYIKADSYILWSGEDDSLYIWRFNGSTMTDEDVDLSGILDVPSNPV